MIRFGGRSFSLLTEPQTSDKVGNCSDQSGTITLMREGDIGVRELGFLEEVVHAADFSMGLGLSHKLVKALAFGIQSFLRQNIKAPPNWFERFYDDPKTRKGK